ncbi:hypothetical protein V1525DRAFT_391540 [Lipomyces kononenkoae]|uniref:Uncharacterized protein n=1 Tax=Lipomyces kononenkoae TaxID=34357 RepID=A0ACC3SRV0_LIPKO
MDQPHGFSNRIEKVAFVGAGGHLGKHIAEYLLKTGKHYQQAARSGPQMSPRVDYSGDDDTALVEVEETAIITMSVTAPRDTVSKLVRAAAKAGVPYVMPIWFGHDPANDTLCIVSLLSANRDGICAEIKFFW